MEIRLDFVDDLCYSTIEMPDYTTRRDTLKHPEQSKLEKLGAELSKLLMDNIKRVKCGQDPINQGEIERIATEIATIRGLKPNLKNK